VVLPTYQHVYCNENVCVLSLNLLRTKLSALVLSVRNVNEKSMHGTIQRPDILEAFNA
jgi:ethanolamine utilization cobalamin adenosyltransferase